MDTVPAVAWWNAGTRYARLVFPAPVGPTRAMISPTRASRLMLCGALLGSHAADAQVTFLYP